MAHKPLFSIITVCYNASSTIGETLRSVDSQECKNYEHIIIDGASKDSTLSVIREYPNSLRAVTSQPDRGIYDAMNKGISYAKGEYLVFLNAGDAFHSCSTLSVLERAVKENDTPGVVYGQTILVDLNRVKVADRHLYAPEKLTYESFKDGMTVCHQAFIPLAKLAPLYDTRYKYSADYDWCIQCLQHSRKNVYVPHVIIDYLQEGATTAHHSASLWERFKIMGYYYGWFTAIARHISFIPRFIVRRAKHLKQ